MITTRPANEASPLYFVRFAWVNIYADNFCRSANVLLPVFGICFFARSSLSRGEDEASYWQKQLNLPFRH